MALKKRLIVAGLLCSFSTSSALYSDDVISEESVNSSESQLVQADSPPVLFAPTPNAKPLNEVEKPDKQTQTVSPTVKLSVDPIEPSITPSKPIVVVLPKQQQDKQGTQFDSLLPETGLEGWSVHEGRQEAWQRDGDSVYCQGAGGGWLRTDKEYSDFHLKFDYRLQAGANSGVGLRVPQEGNPTFTAVELQLLDDSAPKYASLRDDQYTGSLYYHVAPTQKPQLLPVNEWNSCEVICKGDQMTIKLNGDIVNEINLAQPDEENQKESGAKWQLAKRPPLGRIALQSSSSRVDFKNLQINDLAVVTHSGVKYVELTTGEGESLSDARQLTVHYVGQLLNGTRFGDTRDLGEPVTVPLEGIIEGWKYGIAGMKVGGRRRLIVPPEMAYGSQGVANLIPPGATLVFEVELCGFER
ncbi:DUF1080 domain-containing protein [bacterium]|nr:DUF1080 domain-containing protein [bacterium]